MDRFTQSRVRNLIKQTQDEIDACKRQKERELELLSFSQRYRQQQIKAIKESSMNEQEKAVEIEHEEYLLQKEVIERNGIMETNDKLIGYAENRLNSLSQKLKRYVR